MATLATPMAWCSASQSKNPINPCICGSKYRDKYTKKEEMNLSVRVNDRHLSDIEYENTYSALYLYISNKIKHLPKRYKYFLGKPFNDALNNIYEEITKMTFLYLNENAKGSNRYKLGVQILEDFKTVISLSYIMWILSSGKNNEIKYIKLTSRDFWVAQINKEMSLVFGVIKKCRGYKEGDVAIPYMKSFSSSQINEAIFLNKLSKLVKVIYKVAIQTNKDFRDAQIDMLVKLSRGAFYNAFTGNEILVTDKYTYKRREKLFSDAISDLFAMNRPVMELSFAEVFSENDLREICNLITDSTKILKAIRKSEQEKFSNIE